MVIKAVSLGQSGGRYGRRLCGRCGQSGGRCGQLVGRCGRLGGQFGRSGGW